MSEITISEAARECACKECNEYLSRGIQNLGMHVQQLLNSTLAEREKGLSEMTIIAEKCRTRELEQLAEIAQLRAQLEKTEKQFGVCSICNYAAWRDRNKDTEQCVVCELRAQLDAAQACVAICRMVVDKVESGRMRSRETYAAAVAALKNIEEAAPPA